MGEAWSLVPHTAFAGAVVLDSLRTPLESSWPYTYKSEYFVHQNCLRKIDIVL
jgi:hypothetical protein